MKKSIAVLAVILLMIGNVGCRADINAELDKRFKDIESYSACVTVTVLGNGKSESFKMQQTWKAPDKYKSEITEPEHMKGTVSVINADGIWLKIGDAPPVRMEQGTESMNTEYMFISDFLKDYYAEEHADKLVEDSEGKVMLNASTRGTNKKRFTQNLSVDVRHKYMPDKLQTFDSKGNEVLRVEFEKFTPNIKIDDSEFNL